MSNQLLLRRRMMTANRPDYLRFTALEDSTVALMKNGNFSRDLGLEYAVNRGEFLPYEIGDVVTLNKDDFVEFRRGRDLARAVDFSSPGNDYCYFATTGSVVGTGSIDTLVYWRGDINIYNRSYSFRNVFPSNGGTLTMPFTIPNSVTVLALSAFEGCSGFTGGLTIPDSVTWISGAAFEYCSGFTGSLTIPDSVMGIEQYAFSGCRFTNVYVPARIRESGMSNADNGQGITIVEGDRTLNAYLSGANLSNRYMVVKGNLTVGLFVATAEELEALWVEGDLIKDGDGITLLYGGTPRTMFVGVDGTVMVTGTMFRNNNTIADGCILHFAGNGIAATPTQACASYSRLSKVYVGDGSSQAADEAVLALYLADADWAQYASKLDIWWNYNGPYKTQPVFPTN